MALAANEIEAIVDFTHFRALTDQNHLWWRAAVFNTCRDNAEIIELEENFLIANAHLIVLKPLEERFYAELEEIYSKAGDGDA